jgi:hypothetical protein
VAVATSAEGSPIGGARGEIKFLPPSSRPGPLTTGQFAILNGNWSSDQFPGKL